MFRLLVSLILSFACAHALADPPVRVARLAYLHGPISFSPAGTDDWALASLNRPLIAGDRLWTDRGGRDELQLGGAALRMDDNTLLSILTLDDRVLQVQLSQGSLIVRVRPGPAAGTVEVDTPNMALTIDQPGHYRVDVDAAGATTVRVDDGQAQATGQYQAWTINPGQYARFTGPDLRNFQSLDPRYRDDFDRWAAARDQRADRALAARYVSPATIGYDDLDDYGTWRTVPTYGHVWIPRGVSRGWAPYRDGHWAWIEPWGWTWIDDAPWGFAVTHYGRWANLGNDWAWVPEPANAMPVYAPALVAFAGVTLARTAREPAVAWFPLAPREPYRPPYQASPRYVSAINYNITNVTNIVYANRQVRGAVTAVPASAFTRAQPVRRMAFAIPQERIVQATVIPAPQVQARRESIASRLSGGHRPAPALLARPAMTHLRPAIAHAPTQPAAAVGPQHQDDRRDRAMSHGQPPATFVHGPHAAARQNLPPVPAPGLPNGGAVQPRMAGVPAPHPDIEAERRALQAMHQPPQRGMEVPRPLQAQGAGVRHEAPQPWARHGQPPHADEQHAGPPAALPQQMPPQFATPQRGPHGAPPYQQQRPQAAAQPAPQRPMPAPPRGQERHGQAMPGAEQSQLQQQRPQPAPMRPLHEQGRGNAQHAQPAPRAEPPHIEPPHPQMPHAAEPPRPQPQHAAPAPRPEPPHPQMQHTAAPPHAEPPHPQPQHAPPAPRPEPPHPQPQQAPPASHAQPPQPPHPAAPPSAHGPEASGNGKEHGQHGHKDDHH